MASWRANFPFGARQLPCWRTPNQDLARQLTTWRAPKPCPASACSFLRPLAALTLTPLALFRPPALGVKQVRNRVLVQQALQLREGGLFDPHVDGHMALSAECNSTAAACRYSTCCPWSGSALPSAPPPTARTCAVAVTCCCNSPLCFSHPFSRRSHKARSPVSGSCAVLRAASAAFSCSRSSLFSASRRRISAFSRAPPPRLPLPALPPGGWSWGEGAWSP